MRAAGLTSTGGEAADRSTPIRTQLTGRALFEAAAAEVGAAPASRPTGHTRLTPCGSTRRTQSPEEIAREIAFTLSRCVPATGTLAETYLTSRLLPLPDTPDLLFHPDLTYYAARTAWPAMVAVARDAAGAVIGVHRTYLARNGSGKASIAKPKMTLGEVLGGAVRLCDPLGGTFGVAEGVETAIAASVLFRMPVWPTLSTSGMRAFAWPAGIERLVIFADAGLAGEAAALHLAERAASAGLASRIERPLHGDDFADDLRRGVEAP
jgi:putative DNA primase/helicase